MICSNSYNNQLQLKSMQTYLQTPAATVYSNGAQYSDSDCGLDCGLDRTNRLDLGYKRLDSISGDPRGDVELISDKL